jgi:biopolymer transport protein ExbB
MWDFIRAGGPFMILLVGTSVVGLTFIIERGLALRWSKVIPARLETTLANCRSREDTARLRQVAAEETSSLGRLTMVAIDHLNSPREENVDAVENCARREVLELERGLVVLEVVVGIAPLLGLVGTIHGLTTLFGDLGNVGSGDNASLAKGIAIALNTTLTGLLIAVPALVTWSYYTKKVETLTVELETLCDEFLRRHYRLNTER